MSFDVISNEPMLIALLVILGLILVGIITILIKLASLNKKYKAFTKLSGEINIEEVLISNQKAIKGINEREEVTASHIETIYNNLKVTYEKMAIVKYNAFEGMGGESSAVIVLMNKKLNGYLVNSIHTREGNHMYVKQINGGKCERTLSSEEEEAIKKAR